MGKIIIFGAFHYDVAYMETFEGYMPRCMDIIDQGLELLDRHNDFIFCIEQIVLVDAYYQRRPENRDRMKKHAADKRLIFCPGMWTMPDGNIPSAESCYQNALIGRKWLKENLGVEPGPICWMADIFGHHAQSPQIYKQLGYELYMFERGQLEEERTVDFLWEGIDGTRLPAHWESDTYYGVNSGLAWLGDRSEEWIINRIRETVIEPLGGVQNDIGLSKIGGDFLKPDEKYLSYITKWNMENREPEMVFAHPEKYIRHLQDNSQLKTIKAELNPLLQGTYSSRIRIKQLNRKLENLAYAREALSVVSEKPEETVLWRDIVTRQFHDTICGTLCDKAWKETVGALQALHETTLTALRKQLQGKGGNSIVVFNPLPYKRTEVVELSEGAELLALDAMEAATIENARKENDFEPVRIEGRALDNGLIRAEVDELGRLIRIIDHTSGQTYQDQRFGFIHDIALEPDFGDLWVVHQGPINSSLLHTAPYHDPAMPSAIKMTPHGIRGMKSADSQCFPFPEIRAEAKKNNVSACISAEHKMGYTITYCLNVCEKLLRIKVEHKLGSIQRRLRAVIPTGISQGTIRREVPAGFIEQEQGEYPAQNWMDYSDDNKGLCVLNRGLPGNNVTDGVMLLTLFRSVVMFEPGVMPDFELDIAQDAEYAIVPFRPDDTSYSPARLGRCFNQPFITASDSAVPNINGTHICLESDTVEIMAVRFSGEDKDIELRMGDVSGKPTKVTLKSSRPLGDVLQTTPLGKVLGKISHDKFKINLKLKPFEIITILIKV